MPVNKKKMKALKETYGDKAEQVYYAMENKAKQKGKKKRKAKKEPGGY